MSFIYYKKLNIGILYIYTTNNIKDIVNNGQDNSLSSHNPKFIIYIINKLTTYLIKFQSKNYSHNLKQNIYYINHEYFELIYNAILPILISALENENQQHIKLTNELFDIYLKIYNNIHETTNYQKLNRPLLTEYRLHILENQILLTHYNNLMLFIENIEKIYEIKNNYENIVIKNNNYSTYITNNCTIL